LARSREWEGEPRTNGGALRLATLGYARILYAGGGRAWWGGGAEEDEERVVPWQAGSQRPGAAISGWLAGVLLSVYRRSMVPFPGEDLVRRRLMPCDRHEFAMLLYRSGADSMRRDCTMYSSGKGL
jgi:hypothetical protein